MGVLLAFGGTHLTEFRANPANPPGEPRPVGLQLRTRFAQPRALEAQPHTLSHLHIFQTRIGTAHADADTLKALSDTPIYHFLGDSHGEPPLDQSHDASGATLLPNYVAAEAATGAPSTGRPTLITALTNSPGRPHKELRKIAVTLVAIAAIAQTG